MNGDELRSYRKKKGWTQQKVADLVQLALWLDAIGFLDLLELAKSITDSEADQGIPQDVKLAKALATWARATIKATESRA